jgi:hypothetical protein
MISALIRFCWVAAVMGALFFPVVLRPAACFGQDVTIGAVEEVVLLPWGIRLPARIDTGAATTSLDVCEMSIQGDTVAFRLADRCGGQVLRLPLKTMRSVRSSSGHQVRPIVEMTLCIGRRKMQIEVNLVDRSRMTYPFLVGRNVIEKGFLVDVRQTNMLPPDCGDWKAP